MVRVDLRVGTAKKPYGGFKNFALRRSMEEISSVFHFGFSDQWTPEDKPWPLKPQDPVEVLIEGVPLTTGYIDVLDADLTDTERNYSVRGRDKTCDLVDCSAPVKLSEMRNLTLLEICKKLSAGLGISFIEGPGTWDKGKIPIHKVNEGDTIFESIMHAANKAGALLMPDGRGNVIITNAGTKKAVTKLVEGQNIKKLSFIRDESKRFSHYTVGGVGRPAKGGVAWAKGLPLQSNDSTKMLPRATVLDKGMSRYRPHQIRQRGVSDPAMVKRIAEYEAKIAEAKSLKISVTVEGFEQVPGIPWDMNMEVQVIAPRLGLADTSGDIYVISQVEFTLAEGGGTTTQLELLPKNAFISKPEIEKKKKDRVGILWSREDKAGQSKILPKEK